MVIRDPEARLLAGPTAFALLRMRFRGTTVALVFLAIIYVVNASELTQFIWAIYISAAAMLVSVLFAAFLIVYVAIKTEAEGEAGYTTLGTGNWNNATPTLAESSVDLERTTSTELSSRKSSRPSGTKPRD